jgi:hypothetical protein
LSLRCHAGAILLSTDVAHVGPVSTAIGGAAAGAMTT